MSCGITSGIAINCEDLRAVGGVNKRAFIFNLDDLADAKYTENGGDITALNFETYKGMYEFTSKKKSHSGGYSVANPDAGSNKFFTHSVTVKLFPDTSSEDIVIEDLIVGNFGLILEDNNENFFLYGALNGMEVTEGTQNTGQDTNSDISDNLTFTGEEKKKPRRIIVTDYATTKSYLEGLVV